jgi:hypothetical protein
MSNVTRVDIHKDYLEKKTEIMRLTNNQYEEKMMAKGYRYTQVLGEMVATWTFASPKRQLEIAAANEQYLERKKNKLISK